MSLSIEPAPGGARFHVAARPNLAFLRADLYAASTVAAPATLLAAAPAALPAAPPALLAPLNSGPRTLPAPRVATVKTTSTPIISRSIFISSRWYASPFIAYFTAMAASPEATATAAATAARAARSTRR